MPDSWLPPPVYPIDVDPGCQRLPLRWTASSLRKKIRQPRVSDSRTIKDLEAFFFDSRTMLIWGIVCIQYRKQQQGKRTVHIFPGRSSGLVQELEMLVCSYCGASKLRLSRFRSKDLFKLILLKRPVRCRLCDKRAYTTLLTAWKIGRDDEARHRDQRQQ